MVFRERQSEPHGRRSQRRAIVFILRELEIYDSYGSSSPPLMEIIYQSCHISRYSDVHVRTLWSWWGTCVEWGELPYHVQKRKVQMRGYHKNMWIDKRELTQLKLIVDEYPNYYLDEIALTFGIETGKFVHLSTVWRYMTEGLG